jgi:hypothetical protein
VPDRHPALLFELGDELIELDHVGRPGVRLLDEFLDVLARSNATATARGVQEIGTLPFFGARAVQRASPPVEI